MSVPRPLPWDSSRLQRLLAAARNDRLAHAWLLEGPRGLGKRDFAVALAWALLCRAPEEEGACGQCSACLLLAAGSHADLRRVEPEEERRAIRIEQVRDTVDFMSKTAQGGGRRVILIQPAEAMNASSANALLKSLEEPGQGTVLLLVSHQGGLLPATIRSRCQTLRFLPPPREQALRWLEGQGAEAPEALLDLADGLPLRALALAGEESRAGRRLLLEQLTAVVLQGLSPLAAAESCASLGLDSVLEGMLLCLLDVLRHLQSAGAVALREAGLVPIARQLLESGEGEALLRTCRRLHALQTRLLSARRAIAGNSNPNVLLLLENVFIDWRRIAASAGTAERMPGRRGADLLSANARTWDR